MFTPNCLVIATTIYLLIIAKQVSCKKGRKSLKWQGIMTAILTSIVNCISVLPYVVYIVGESIVGVDEQSSSFFHTSFFRIGTSFAYLNTISNLYIYSLSVNSFRNFIRSRIQNTYRMFTRIGSSASHGREIINVCSI